MKTISREIVLLLVFTSVVLASTKTCSLGEGFYLASKNILGEFDSGESIFSNIPPDCVNVVPRPETKQEISYFKDTESFYRYISTKAEVSEKLEGSYTMGTTLQLKSKSISGATFQVSGLTLDIYALTETMFFSPHCQNTLPLSKTFLADFQKLPVKIKDPNDKNDWLAYKSFLNKYGSHIVKEINTGSRLQQWVFATSCSSYSERDFSVRACVDLSSDTGSLKVGVCANVTSEEKRRVEKLTMSDTLDLKGGTAATRAKLRQVRSADLIEKFMIEAQTSPGNVLYKWTAIWDVLKQRFLGKASDNLARSLNMEAYYEGVLDFGCTTKSKSGVTLRQFEESQESNLPVFSCKLAALGCRKYDDCHLGGAGSVCYCYGNSCVDTREVKNNPTSKIKEERFMRTEKAGSYYEGINNSCNYHFVAYCDCDTNWAKPVTVWPTKAGLQDRRCFLRVHSMMKQPT